MPLHTSKGHEALMQPNVLWMVNISAANTLLRTGLLGVGNGALAHCSACGFGDACGVSNLSSGCLHHCMAGDASGPAVRLRI